MKAKRTYYIKTFGCQMNEIDSERIARFLENKEYKKASSMEEADLIVVNACSVRQSAVDRVFGLKPRLQNSKAKKILTGCILKSDKKNFRKFFDQVLSIKEFLGEKYLSEIKLNFKLALVPIMTGCNNFCSYCVVPYTRGREVSRPVLEIVEEVKRLIKKGHKEIILLGQNVNSYLPIGKTGKYEFAKLLQKLNSLSGNFQIKFLTNHPKDVSSKLIDVIANCEKIAKEIHLPVQSGDNKILKKMNRGYTVKQYKNLIKKIRKKIPNIKISTDVIVGFPNETKKQFKNTVKLFKKIKYSSAYINKYSPRAGTASEKLRDNILWEEKKRRWKILDEIVNHQSKPKLITIIGSTASGKSELAVKLAKEFNGEIISADSRQVYKEMNIGTGKITKKEMNGIIHYCLDIAKSKKQFNIVQYRKRALKAINKIYKKGKIPILCGGTGFYIQAIAGGLSIPEVKPDLKLRKKLEKLSAKELFKKLKKLDSQRAKQIDFNNRRRLIRAIEIVEKTGKPISKLKKETQFNVLSIGIKKSISELEKLIDKRVDKMIKQGLEKEVKVLVKKYGWTVVLKNSIGYQEWDTEKTKKEIIKDIKLHTRQFAKKQMTWFLAPKKYPREKIYWVENYSKSKKIIKKFLSN